MSTEKNLKAENERLRDEIRQLYNDGTEMARKATTDDLRLYHGQIHNRYLRRALDERDAQISEMEDRLKRFKELAEWLRGWNSKADHHPRCHDDGWCLRCETEAQLRLLLED